MSLPRLSRILPLLALTLMVAGCDLIGDVLEFGFWVLVIIVLLIVAVIWLIARAFRSRRRGPPPTAP